MREKKQYNKSMVFNIHMYLKIQLHLLHGQYQLTSFVTDGIPKKSFDKLKAVLRTISITSLKLNILKYY